MAPRTAQKKRWITGSATKCSSRLLPPDPLPRCCVKWPLDSKFPMLGSLKDRIIFYRTKLSKPLIYHDRSMDFDAFKTPNFPGKYDALHDPNLREYLSKKVRRRSLLRNGLITCDSFVKCSLQELNSYRKYLHGVYGRIWMQQKQEQAMRLRNRVIQIQGKIHRCNRKSKNKALKTFRDKMRDKEEKQNKKAIELLSEKHARAQIVLLQNRKQLEKKALEANALYDLRTTIAKQKQIEEHRVLKGKLESRDEEDRKRINILKQKREQNARKGRRKSYKLTQKGLQQMNNTEEKRKQYFVRKLPWTDHHRDCVKPAVRYYGLLDQVNHFGMAGLRIPKPTLKSPRITKRKLRRKVDTTRSNSSTSSSAYSPKSNLVGSEPPLNSSRTSGVASIVEKQLMQPPKKHRQSATKKFPTETSFTKIHHKSNKPSSKRGIFRGRKSVGTNTEPVLKKMPRYVMVLSKKREIRTKTEKSYSSPDFDPSSARSSTTSSTPMRKKNSISITKRSSQEDNLNNVDFRENDINETFKPNRTSMKTQDIIQSKKTCNGNVLPHGKNYSSASDRSNREECANRSERKRKNITETNKKVSSGEKQDRIVSNSSGTGTSGMADTALKPKAVGKKSTDNNQRKLENNRTQETNTRQDNSAEKKKLQTCSGSFNKSGKDDSRYSRQVVKEVSAQYNKSASSSSEEAEDHSVSSNSHRRPDIFSSSKSRTPTERKVESKKRSEGIPKSSENASRPETCSSDENHHSRSPDSTSRESAQMGGSLREIKDNGKKFTGKIQRSLTNISRKN